MSNILEFSESFLSSGQKLKLSEYVQVKHPTYGDIVDIDDKWNGFYSEELYYNMLMIFISDPYMEMVWLDDNKIDYEAIDSFDLFVMKFKKQMEMYDSVIEQCHTDEELEKIMTVVSNDIIHMAFKFFLGEDNILLGNVEKNNTIEYFIVNPDNQKFVIDRDVFNNIAKFLRSISGVSFKDRINPANKFAKQTLIEDERARLKKLQRNPPENKSGVLGSQVSALCWGGNGGITVFNKRDLHIYDIIDGIKRTQKVFNFNHVMSGVYFGNVQYEKLNMNEVSWMS